MRFKAAPQAVPGPAGAAGLCWRLPARTDRVREAAKGAQMTAGSPARAAGSQPRRELALLLLLGAAGAGLALLAARQGWARVETTAPRPLPASVTTVTGQALVPAAGALALAALAGLAAVLAARLGAGLALAVSAGISAADVRAAAAAAAPGSSGAAAGSGVGST